MVTAFVVVRLLPVIVNVEPMQTDVVLMLEMVGAGVFGLESPRLSSAITLQYYAVLIGYFILGLVFCRLMEGRRADVPTK